MKINPKQMQQAMKRMGIVQVEVPASTVVIKSEGCDLVFDNPQVSKVNMMGQETYQITGEPRKVSQEVPITEEDIKTVMDQVGVDETKARDALVKSDGDIAAAILSLQE